MKRYLIDMVFYVLAAIVIKMVSYYLQSTFVSTFLENSIISTLIALLAINTTTMSILLSKLKEVSEKTGNTFSNTIQSLKNSRFEQVGLIVLSIFSLILKKKCFDK